METKSKLTTLCYIEKDEKYLMLHRVLKKNDINKDKWIGVGGHFEKGESPEDCLLREVKEEPLTDFAGLLPLRFLLREEKQIRSTCAFIQRMDMKGN